MRNSKYPKIALFDLTPIGHKSATGQIKLNLFGGWPKEKILGIHAAPEGSVKIAHGETRHNRNLGEAFEEIQKFDPDIIFYRPLPDNKILHEFAMTVIHATDKPLATWIVDDWPASLAVSDSDFFRKMDKDFRYLLSKSAWCCSISESMSKTFEKRYGVKFDAVANGVDPEDWKRGNLKKAQDALFKVRYAGGLAENMNRDSVIRLAQAIESLSVDYPISFELLTREHWWDTVKSEIGDFKSISVDTKMRTAPRYRSWLMNSDCVVIAYNFDEASLRYIADSFANKLPECLASGSVVFAHGPRDVASIAYLDKHDCAIIVDQPDQAIIKNALVELMNNADEQNRISSQGRKIALKNHNLGEAREKLYSKLQSISPSSIENNTIGGDRTKKTRPVKKFEFETYSRQQATSLDEVHLIYELFNHTTPKTMIDVGAHRGGSSERFADKNWKIFAFEPDPTNRKVFKRRLGQKKNITLDSRAVGEHSETATDFYASKESSGISGMLAFRDSHYKVASVDVTTIERVAEDNNIKHIDFLKIDVEGFDYSVLKGVPWGRLKPDVVTCEFEDAKTLLLGHDWEEICKYLVSHGYTVYVSMWHPVIRYGIPHDWNTMKKYPCDVSDKKGWGNILAFKNDPGEAAIAEAIGKVIKFRKPQMTKPMPASEPSFDKPNDSFAVKLRKQSPALFRVAQFGKWLLSFLKRHAIPTALLVFLALFLTISPLIFVSLAPYKLALWAVALVALASFMGVAAIAFANMMAHRIAHREVVARAELKAEILREMQTLDAKNRKIEALIDEKIYAQSDKDNLSRQRMNERLAEKIRRNNESAKRLSQNSERRIQQLDARMKTSDALFGEMDERLNATLKKDESSRQRMNERLSEKIRRNNESAKRMNERSASQLGELQHKLENVYSEYNQKFAESMVQLEERLDSYDTNRKSDLKELSIEVKQLKELEKITNVIKESVDEIALNFVENSTEISKLAADRSGDAKKIVDLHKIFERDLSEAEERSLETLKSWAGAIKADISDGDLQQRTELDLLKTSTEAQLETLKALLFDQTEKLNSALREDFSEVSNEVEELKKFKQAQSETLKALLFEETEKLTSALREDFSEVSNEVEELKKLEKMTNRIKERIDETALNLAENSTEISKLAADRLKDAKKIADLPKSFETEVSKVDERSLETLRSWAGGIRADIIDGDTEQKKEIDRLKSSTQAQMEKLNTVLSKISERIDKNSMRNSTSYSEGMNQLATRLDGLNSERNKINQSLEAALQEIQTLEQKLAKTERSVADEKTGVTYQHFNRVLTAGHVNEIKNNWLKPLKLDETRKSLAYSAERISLMERQLRGRLATSIENAVLRTLVAKSVEGRKLRVLEIGVLFGTGIAMINDVAADNFDEIHFTAIDPLEGYYGNDVPDLITKAKVNKRNLMKNIETAKISADQFTLLEGFSTEDAIIKAASKKRYDLLIIDGDHSYAGVKADFVHYAPFVKLGGYIIIDDDSAPEWPEITKYVDDELLTRDDISLVGRSWRSAVFRVIKKVKI